MTNERTHFSVVGAQSVPSELLLSLARGFRKDEGIIGGGQGWGSGALA